MTSPVPLLPGMTADEYLAHTLAHREWTRRGCRQGMYPFWLHMKRRHIATMRAAGVDPTAPRGEDGPATLRPRSPSVADDGLGAARGCVFVAGLVALVVAYLVAINAS